jgi:hypothetical protein
MLLAPYREWTVTTPAPTDVARERVQALVRDGLFAGETFDDRLTLLRRIDYRNSFLPAIDVTFHPLAAGTDVRLRARIHWSVSIFMAVWCGFLLLFLGRHAWTLWEGGTVAPADLGIPAAMLVFGYGLTMGGFLVEARKGHRLLAERLLRPVSAVERAATEARPRIGGHRDASSVAG